MFPHEYIGNLHIHSLHSDGARTVQAIAESAARRNLDFICLNDHAHTSGCLHLEEEGFHGKVLVLVGAEIGVRYHHYLAYDLKEAVNEHGLGPQGVIDSVKGQGGFGFLAHPFEKGMPFLERSVAYTWNDLTVTGFTGICIWNFTSRWKERVRTVLHGLYCLAFKTQTLQGPSRETLAYWDGLCRTRRVVAVGGSDAHGSEVRYGPLRVTPLAYDYLLSTVNIHIFMNRKMPKDFREAKKEVYEAMREGRLFVAHDGLCPARGFRFDFNSEEGSDLYMGEEGSLGKGGEMVVELPREGEIRLIRDGKIYKRWRGREAFHKVTEKGVYRVEAYLRIPFFGWRPWIFSNPIYLR